MSETTVDPNLTVQQAQDLVTGWIDDYRSSLASNFFTYNDHQWDCDQQSINNITGINVISLLNGGNLPAGILWRDYNNNYVSVTGAYMGGMALSYVSFAQLAYNASWTHKANVLALNDSILIQDYVWQNTLWPDPTQQY
jgi:hypothetical protein